MKELLYLLLGWLLGLIGPRIIDSIKAKYSRRDLCAAIRVEAQDLQYRVAITSFLLAQRFGGVTREYLEWLKPKLAKYQGNEPVESIRKFVETLLAADDNQMQGIINHMRAEEGVGLSLKRFSASLIESSLVTLHNFPADYQNYVHEFRNQMSPLNQEIEAALLVHRMTFDSRITEENHRRLTNDLNAKYQIIRGMCIRVADRLEAVIEYDQSRI
jgi:hypothetical protein